MAEKHEESHNYKRGIAIEAISVRLTLGSSVWENSPLFLLTVVAGLGECDHTNRIITSSKWSSAWSGTRKNSDKHTSSAKVLRSFIMFAISSVMSCPATEQKKKWKVLYCFSVSQQLPHILAAGKENFELENIVDFHYSVSHS